MERIRDIIQIAYVLGIASTVSGDANVDAASAVVSLEALVCDGYDEDPEVPPEDIEEYLRKLEEETASNTD